MILRVVCCLDFTHHEVQLPDKNLMKRLISLLMMLTVCVGMMANKIGGLKLSSTAKTTYDTSSGMSITSGTIDWDPTTNTLTLNRAVINTREVALYIDVPTTIVLNGGCAITSRDNIAMEIHANTVIKSATAVGNGSINVTSQKDINAVSSPAIRAYGCSLDIEPCTMNIKSETLGALVSNGNSDAEVLNVRGADLTLTSGSTWAVMYNWARVNLVACEFTVPTGAKYSESDHGLYCDGEAVKGKANIRMKKYPVYVAGTQVTGRNMTDVLNDGSVKFADNDGGWSYTLSLKDASIECKTSCLEFTSGCDAVMNIDVEGVCSLISTGGNAIYANNPSSVIIRAVKPESKLECKSLNTGWGDDNDAIHIGYNVGVVDFDSKSEFSDMKYPFALDVYSEKGDALSIENSDTYLYFEHVNASFLSAGGNPAIDGVFTNAPWFEGCYLESHNNYYDDIKYDPEEQRFIAEWSISGNRLPHKLNIAYDETYYLYVGGVSVSALNKDNITGPNIQGKVWYDSSTTTLYLDNARITGNDRFAIWLQGNYLWDNTLKICLIGNNTITSNDDCITLSYCNFEIYSECNGVLDIKSYNGYGVRSQSYGITIRDCKVNIESKYACIKSDVCNTYGEGSRYLCKLDLQQDVALSMYSSQAYPLDGIASFTMPSDLYFSSPFNAKIGTTTDSWSREMVCIADEEGNPVNNATIYKDYRVSVCHYMISSINADNFTCPDLVEGKVWFDSKSFTLYLENATIDSYGGGIIDMWNSKVDKFRICLIGKNTLIENRQDRNSSVIKMYSHELEIFSLDNGELTIRSEGGVIDVSSSYITIKDCVVNVDSKFAFISNSTSSNQNTLDLQSAFLTLNSLYSNPLEGVETLYMSYDLFVISPEYAELTSKTNSSGKEMVVAMDSGSELKRFAIGNSYYPYLYVANTEVTPFNASSITGEGISGNVWFDPLSCTLHLDNATIDAGTKEAIYCTDRVNICLTGENTLRSDNICLWASKWMHYSSNLMIYSNSNGTLNMSGPHGISGFDVNAVFKDCNVNINAEEYCIGTAFENTYYNLDLQGAFLTMKSKEALFNDGMKNLTMSSDVSLLSPKNGILGKRGGVFGVFGNNGEAVKQVVIGKKYTDSDVLNMIGKYINNVPGVTMKGIVDMVDKKVVYQ